MIAVLIMGSRYRPVTVWIGATLAFAVHVTVAVAVGRLLQLLPHRWVEGVTAALFAAGSAYLLFVPEKEEEEKGEEEADQARRGLRTVTAAFLVILVGEYGDLTQILTVNLAAKYHSAISVFVGAMAGLAAASPAIAPTKTEMAEWYLAARLTVSIWVRSPYSPTRMTRNAAVTVLNPRRAWSASSS